MSNLTQFEFDHQFIREQDGLYSVYDIIRVIGGILNPHQYWLGDKSKRATRQKGFIERYPEVLRKTDNLKFPGRGQRLTPVCNKQVALEIIGLLPGEVGAKYRQEAAKLFIAYVDADIALADDIIQRNQSDEDLEWIKARVEGKIVRKAFTDELKDRGVRGIGYAINTDNINKGITGYTAKEIKVIRKVKHTRDGLTGLELSAISLAEKAAIAKMEQVNAKGNHKTAHCSRLAADHIKEAINKLLKQ